MTSSQSYTITISGQFLNINFDNSVYDDSIFTISLVSIYKVKNNIFIITDGTKRLILDYTLCSNHTLGTLDLFIDHILTLLKSERINNDNGVNIVLGDIDNIGHINKFGRNPNIDTNTIPEDIWSSGGDYTGFPTGTPETIAVVSTSTNDTSGGTGARTVRIEGLKSTTSSAYETEDITLTGTTTATSTNTWYRVNRMYVLTAGTLGYNEGTITFNHSTTTANVFGTIEAQRNQSTIAVYTIPYQTTGYIIQYSLSLVRASGAAGSGEISLRARDTSGVFRSIDYFDITNSQWVNKKFSYPKKLDSLTDIKFRVEDVSDNATIINASFTILLVDDDVN